MNVTLSPPSRSAAAAWSLLFELATERSEGWVLAGARMVILHAAAHDMRRPAATRDADLLIDVRRLPTTDVASWLTGRGFELDSVGPDNVGHRLRRGALVIDVLAIDHIGSADRTTVAPARTVEVPGGRRAVGRAIDVRVTVEDHDAGRVPTPDWLGAVLLKARAVTALPDERAKHCQDLALLLGLPVDVAAWRSELRGSDRSHLRRAMARLDDEAWQAVSSSIDVRTGRAAAQVLTR